MLPEELAAILAVEKKAVAQVVLEIMQQTLGFYDPSSPTERREWAKLSARHFVRRCGMSHSQAKTGLKTALNLGYILRRPCANGFEYAIRFAEPNGGGLE